jgi:hypothetical protein
MNTLCPNCKTGELAYDAQWAARAKEMVGEFVHPVKLFRVLFGPFYNMFTDVVVLKDQYRCKSCAAAVVICTNPGCEKPWTLARRLQHWERATCPHCRKEYVFRLDAM